MSDDAVRPQTMDRDAPPASGVVLIKDVIPRMPPVAGWRFARMDFVPADGVFRSEKDYYSMSPALATIFPRDEWEANLAAINAAAGCGPCTPCIGASCFKDAPLCSCCITNACPDAGLVDAISKCDEINRGLKSKGINNVRYAIQHKDQTVTRDYAGRRRRERGRKVISHYTRTHWLEVELTAASSTEGGAVRGSSTNVTAVVDDGAAAGFVKSGDKLVAINGTIVTNDVQATAVAKAAVGDVVYSIFRGSEFVMVTVKKATATTKLGVTVANMPAAPAKLPEVLNQS